MSEVPDTVDDALDALTGTPTSDEVYFATEDFPAREIAAAAAALAMGGGSVGGGNMTLSDVLANGNDADGRSILNLSGLTVDKLTGATAETRYVGGTVSGAPVTGTFVKGDFVVAQNGHMLVCTTAGSPGSWSDVGVPGSVASVFGRSGVVTATRSDYGSFFADSRSAPSVFYPEDYGAVGDGSTDDTVAIQAAIDAADANVGGIVQFQAKTYAVNGTPRTDRHGNAILALPRHADIGPTVVLQGAYNNLNNDGGTKLLTTSTATYDGTNKQPSVIGGPTDGVFSYSEVIIRDLGVLVPSDPTISGIDLTYIGRCIVDGVFVASVDAGGSGVEPTHTRQFGFSFPTNVNFNLCRATMIGAYNCFTGVIVPIEHFNADYISVKWCPVGIGIGGGGHGSRIGLLSSEWCTYHIAGVATTVAQPVSNTNEGLIIDQWNIEDALSGWYQTTYHVYDTSNNLRGAGNFNRVGGAAYTILTDGAKNFQIKTLGLDPGYNGGVTLPASGVASGVVYRPMAITISGGTVTQITVDGQGTGLTSGTVVVPPGRTFAVTYSVAPTFKAFLF